MGNRKKRKPIEVPAPWVKDQNRKVASKMSRLSFPLKLPTVKLHVPGLRLVKRLIAGVLLIFNFFIAQVTLTSASATQPLYWLFILNAFILLDYLWKTRKHKIAPKEWGER